MDAAERFDRLVAEPPSAKLVYKVLELDAPMTHGEIADAAVLPTRTTSYALSRLQEAAIIEAVPCPSDPRKNNYRPLPIQDSSETAETADTGKTAQSTEQPHAPEQASD